ncbi:hypothetical protein BI344_14775 [Chromobacterium sphagni]|uniref:Uncharacterized protein n=1 Tax=Chromobacterium sphagni TaxID=1903179 RepID=A0ABX3CEW9_9NEIS|nr:hypothetical protein BI344_14775 [Chromobacterium sphagni]
MRAIEGVQNAAWDLTHLSETIRRVNKANNSSIRLLFASFDAGLRRLAELLFTLAADEFSEGVLIDALVPYWNQAHAERIAKSLAELLAHIDDEGRKQRQANSSMSIDEMIWYGEQLLLSAEGLS